MFFKINYIRDKEETNDVKRGEPDRDCESGSNRNSNHLERRPPGALSSFLSEGSLPLRLMHPRMERGEADSLRQHSAKCRPHRYPGGRTLCDFDPLERRSRHRNLSVRFFERDLPLRDMPAGAIGGRREIIDRIFGIFYGIRMIEAPIGNVIK